jgi:hypothetical protein
MVLRRVGVLSAGKVTGSLWAVYALIWGAIMSVLSVAGVALNTHAQIGSRGLPEAFGGALALVTIVPILYGIVRFLVGVISSFLYNLIARFIGGIKIELEAILPNG